MSLLLAAWGPGCASDPAGGAAERAAYLVGLRTGECDRISDPALSDDCWLAVATRSRDGSCDSLGSQRAKDECWFLEAERSGNAAMCDQAGSFAEDCGRHLFITALPGALGERRIDAVNDARVEALIPRFGFADDPMRAWLEYYKWALGATGDAEPCAAVVDRQRSKACMAAVRELRDPAHRGGPAAPPR